MPLAVDRYVRGSLSEAETASFEERMVWDRNLLDAVDLGDRLRDGMHAVFTQGGAAPGDGRAPFDRIAAWLEKPRYAAAASFLLAVGLAALARTTGPAPDREPVLQDGLPTEIVALFATRSDEAIEVSVSTDSWTVLLADAPYGYDRFRAAVRRRDDAAKTVWSRADLRPTYPESLAVGMPGRLLPGGRYVLTLDGVAPGADGYERIQEIAFVVSPDPPYSP